MVDSEKGHIFFWRTPDFRPVRTLFSLCAAGLVVFLLITRIPLPFSEAMQTREESKTKRVISSQNLKPVIVVPADRLTVSGITSHFSYNDPLNATSTVSQIVDKALSKKSNELLGTYKNTLTPHEIQYEEIPYTLPKVQTQKVIIPAVPLRNVELNALTPKPAPEFTLKASINPKIQLPALPDKTLIGDRQKLSYQLSVSPSGDLLYAAPLDLAYKNEPLENWISKISFPKSESPTIYSLSFLLQRK